MGKNFLYTALKQNNPKKNNFDYDSDVISYKTGFPILDYYLGYKINVFNDDGKLESQYPSIGIADGCFVCFIGKPSTGKTTMAVQIASNIVREFDNGFVLHYDLEQGMNYSRIQILSRFDMTQLKEDSKYILKQGRHSLEEIKSSIVQIWKEKKDNPNQYVYNTGKLNEFGEEVKIFEPTVVVIDSIPMLTTTLNENDKKEMVKLEEVSSQTDRMRLTGEIGRFYNEIAPLCKETNIIVISINQIKTNPNMGIVKSPSEILYLKQDEALPGGKAPQFLANILIKFIAVGSEKSNAEEDGFDGFGLKLDIIKSRTNQAGQSVSLIYDKVRGVDSLRSSVNFAKDLGFISGNRNGYYFIDHKDEKFTLMNMKQDFADNRNLYNYLYGCIIPILEKRLSGITPEEMYVPDDELNY